jgi:hypothetical protein
MAVECPEVVEADAPEAIPVEEAAERRARLAGLRGGPARAVKTGLLSVQAAPAISRSLCRRSLCPLREWMHSGQGDAVIGCARG